MIYGHRRRGYVPSKPYSIIANNMEVIGEVMAKNSRAAISEYCNIYSIPVINSGSFGECGTPHAYCSKSIYNGMRACGRAGKCTPVFVALTPLGSLTAVGYR